MTTCKTILTPTTKVPKICHALATTSAFNLKLCPTGNVTVQTLIPKSPPFKTTISSIWAGSDQGGFEDYKLPVFPSSKQNGVYLD